ncbi:MAG: DUF4433 domain-containing protein [Capsulimonas sp.]|uniref:type II toxin-antitoxin system toxin DNA ADP-ribosyl transferase DarT n=1 Tax=Capsulimonas sp. TaxID=2494211 RepID=UPI0032638FEB
MSKIIRHMTSVQNLPGILQQGGLWCDRQADTQGLTKQGIGHEHIKKRREKKEIRVGPGGFLSDYVPFYFAHHTPMLSAINYGNVQGYAGGQAEVIYLVTQTDVIQSSGLDFVFTDGHAAVSITRQFIDLVDLDKIDWEMVRANYWKNTEEDGDRERRKQAEFLVHRFLPWSLIRGIAVKTFPMYKQVTTLLQGQTHLPPVRVKPDWYY